MGSVSELAAPVAHRIVECNRLFATQNNAAGNMVIEIVADAGSIGDYGDPVRLQEAPGPHQGGVSPHRGAGVTGVTGGEVGVVTHWAGWPRAR